MTSPPNNKEEKMKKVTRITSIIIILTLVLSIVGCSTSNNPAPVDEKTSDSFPDKAITWVVPWKPGGANDIVARLIGPELEKDLGVPVTITNTDGAGGWIGYNMILSADPDGYTIGNVSLPGLVANYINPETQRENTFRDFAPLVNFARDYVVVCINPDETRFSTFEELVEYSKTNEVKIAGTSGAGDDGVFIAQLDSLEGSQFVHLATGGSSESLTNLYGKHADVAVANVSEVGNPLKGGQLKVIVIAAEERVPQLPEVPTVSEEIGIQIVADSSRGIVTRAGVPDEVLKVLRDSLIKVLKTEELSKKLAEQGIEVDITEWEGYIKIFEATEVQMKEYGPKYFGWDLD